MTKNNFLGKFTAKKPNSNGLYYFYKKIRTLEYLLDITLQNRNILYKFLTETPREKLFKIPEGFNNNIWWNIAHVLVTQQLLVYKMSNLQMRVDDEMVEAYRKGTFPKGEASDEEIKKVAALLLSTVEWLKEDYKNGIFKEYNKYTTSVNVTLNNVEDSIAFNTFHEGLHLGSILALKRAVEN